MTEYNIDLLRKKLNIHEAPIKVRVLAETYSIPDFCFPNVAEKIKRDGGESVFGWQVWSHPFFIEAEFHAIWKSPDGELIDTTPKKKQVDEIIFLKDHTRTYEGRQVNNVRVNTTNNNLVEDYFELWDAKFRLLNKEERAANNYEIKLVGLDAEKYRFLESSIAGVEVMIYRNDNRGSGCFCGSGKKYKNCHGMDLRSKLHRTF